MTLSNLDVNNIASLIDKVMETSRLLMDGNADAIYDGVHDPIGLWFNCGQAKAIINMYQLNVISLGKAGAVLDIFMTKYKNDIQCILNNGEEE